MIVYMILAILITVSIITGIITTIVEHKRLIPKKKVSKISLKEPPKFVYQQIESHISKQFSAPILINTNTVRNTIVKPSPAAYSQIEVLDSQVEVLDNPKVPQIEELI